MSNGVVGVVGVVGVIGVVGDVLDRCGVTDVYNFVDATNILNELDVL